MPHSDAPASLLAPHVVTRLAAALADAGLSATMPDVLDLLAGIAAAPQPRRPTWLSLLTPTRHSGLDDALIATREALAAALALTRPDAARLASLRAELARRGLDGFLVPRADEHQGEYVPLRAQRLAWLTGFTGSAGACLVLAERAVVFVDGRYTLQAEQQTDGALYERAHLVENPPPKWLEAELGAGRTIGFDPWLHTKDEVEKLTRACKRAGSRLAATETNPVDAVWLHQPPPPLSSVVPWSLDYAGLPSREKRQSVATQLTKTRADAAVLTLPDSIAWLLNIRGADVECTPLPLSFALLHRDATVDLFIDRKKLAPGTAEHLGPEVRVHPPSALGPALDALVAANKQVQACSATAPMWVFDRVERAGTAEVLVERDPCQLQKAKKNPTELAGMRAAHVRDGAALTRFLAWIAEVGPTGSVSEIQASDRLEALRAEHPGLVDLSFASISGSGPNGAIVHYRATPESDRLIRGGELYLIDSGAQYEDGTTDVTRTVAIGAPGAEERRRFTLVLKGHIALAQARFPAGTTGPQLDTLARHALWQDGLDYDHGTGHGVGCFLGVHEGPQRIAKVQNNAALEPGMVVSDEPGYYKTGGYGIRIENLVVVTEVGRMTDDASKALLGFETLTLAPIDRQLVEVTMLTAAERAWLNDYHLRVRETLTPLVDAATRAWLASATAAV